jgi:hypothetical protein
MVAMLVLVHLYGVNVPFNDDFDVPGHFLFRFATGDFQWRYLWELHNEHRLVIPKLIWLAEACTARWAAATCSSACTSDSRNASAEAIIHAKGV